MLCLAFQLFFLVLLREKNKNKNIKPKAPEFSLLDDPENDTEVRSPFSFLKIKLFCFILYFTGHICQNSKDYLWVPGEENINFLSLKINNLLN